MAFQIFQIHLNLSAPHMALDEAQTLRYWPQLLSVLPCGAECEREGPRDLSHDGSFGKQLFIVPLWHGESPWIPKVWKSKKETEIKNMSNYSPALSMWVFLVKKNSTVIRRLRQAVGEASGTQELESSLLA
jgi:hypothetical protein